MNIKKYPNGLQMVYQYFDTPLSYCGVIVGSGSRHEKKSEWGVAHLVEHMLFKGTKKRTYLEILDLIEGVGGDMNAYTSKEDTCVYISLLSGFFDSAVDVLSDVCLSSLFESEDLEKEKGVVVDEINSYLDSPSEAIIDDFDDFMFPDSLFGRNILGSKESVEGVSRDDLLAYCGRNYTADNIVFSYSGGLSFEEVEQAVLKYFNVVSHKELFGEPIVKVSVFTEIVSKDTFQAHCVYGRYTVGAFNEDRLYYIFLNSILGGDSFNSFLNLELREENGLTYNIDSVFAAYADIGLFSIYFGTDESKVEQCLDIIRKLFFDFTVNPLSRVVFEERRQQFLGQVALHFDGYLSVMLSNGKSLSVYGSVDSYEVMCDKIRLLDYDMFVAVTRDLLQVDTFSTLIYK